jgi:uncharacterized membrane protein
MSGRAGGHASVLLVGESWVTHAVHQKGFDHFHTTTYTEGAGVLIGALQGLGHALEYVRAHEVATRFPTTREELARHDVVILSDIGANSFLLAPETFVESKLGVNRLTLLADHVRGGGGLLMVGGYMSFAGIDGRARYGQSPLADVLCVELHDRDDRVELPEGVVPTVVDDAHPALRGARGDWPALLGLNQVRARADATTLVTAGADPLLVVGEAGAGRTAAFTSDLAPHWAPPAFVEWECYAGLWSGLVDWVGGA